MVVVYQPNERAELGDILRTWCFTDGFDLIFNLMNTLFINLVSTELNFLL